MKSTFFSLSRIDWNKQVPYSICDPIYCNLYLKKNRCRHRDKVYSIGTDSATLVPITVNLKQQQYNFAQTMTYFVSWNITWFQIIEYVSLQYNKHPIQTHGTPPSFQLKLETKMCRVFYCRLWILISVIKRG